MTSAPSKILRLPCDIAARRERQLAALFAERDRLTQATRALDKQIAPLQREVSLARGFMFTVSREALERPKRKQP